MGPRDGGFQYCCLFCKCIGWTNCLSRHIKVCTKEKPKFLKSKNNKKSVLFDNKCDYCEITTKNKLSKRSHEFQCKLNPNYIPNGMSGKKGKNHYSYGAIMNEDTKIKIGLSNKNRIFTQEARNNMSIAMKKAVLDHPESYTSSNRGRVKQIIVDGVKLLGSWEVLFYNWCKDNKIHCVKNDKGFPYVFDGNRTYYPDFYLKDYDAYIEVKGYKVAKDQAKWTQFKDKLIVIDKKFIDKIKNNEFKLDFVL